MRDRVLITGGAAGIGRAIAERCSRDGYEPVVLDKDGDDIKVDLASPTETREALTQALKGGPIHRLVNNVGIVRPAPLSETTFEDLDAVVAVNIRCAIQCVQTLAPAMMSRGFGRIVSISSRSLLGKPERTVYAGSKAALVGMSRTWALELGRGHVTVNVIAPGPIETPLFRQVNSPALQESIIDAIPVGRIGTPQDIAGAASFLLGKEAGYITGQTLYVCGGTTVDGAGF